MTGQVSDVFHSGKAIVDIASLFTAIMIRAVFLYTASTLDRLWQKKNIYPETKHCINLKGREEETWRTFMTKTKTFIPRQRLEILVLQQFARFKWPGGGEAEYYNVVETQHCLNT